MQIRNHLEKARVEILRVTEPDSLPSIQLALGELHRAIVGLANRAGVEQLGGRG